MSVIKEVRRLKVYNSIISPGPRNNYQLDIMVYNRFEFNKYKYILNVIDVYSRFVDSIALTNVREDTLLDSIKKIFEKIGYPKNLNLDNQFNTKKITQFLTDKNINVYFNQPDEINKNAIVERFNRTLAKNLQKKRLKTKNYNWVSYLDEVINNYNNSVHSRINGKPAEIFSGKDRNKQTIYVVPIKLKLGDYVRTVNKKTLYDKGDRITYSEDIYKIIEILKNKFKIENVKTGKSSPTFFKEYELSKISKNEINDLNNEIIDDTKKVHQETQVKRKLKRLNTKSNLDVGEDGDIIIYDKNKPTESKRKLKPNKMKDFIY